MKTLNCPQNFVHSNGAYVKIEQGILNADVIERLFVYSPYTDCWAPKESTTDAMLAEQAPDLATYLIPSDDDKRKHNHYFKCVSKFEYVDVYRTLLLFGVADPCIQHALKKLLVAGGRGGGKDISRDIQEAIDTLVRWQDMRKEETK